MTAKNIQLVLMLKEDFRLNQFRHNILVKLWKAGTISIFSKK